MRALALLLCLSGCGVFSPNSQSALVAAAAIDRMARFVEERTGKSLDDVPMTCDVEAVPEESEILMLCTVHMDGKR